MPAVNYVLFVGIRIQIQKICRCGHGYVRNVERNMTGISMLQKWKAFIRKIDTKTDDYSTVLKTIRAFLTKPFVAAVENKIFTDNWIVQNGQWM